jgi:2'-5' RNA ligase
MNHSPSPVRCFIAVELPDEARKELIRLQDRLREISPTNTVRWTTPQNIHLTLHFLGDLPVDRLEEVSCTVRDVAAASPAFFLRLSDLGCFPNTRRPRVVWVSVSGEIERLRTLQRELGSQLMNRVHFQPDPRPYSPHLTIGRVKKGIPEQRLRQLGQHIEQEIQKVGELAMLPVERIHFIQSDLRPTGPIYTQIAYGILGA